MNSRMPSSTALTKRSSDSTLMPPPPPPKRIKRPAKVLDEDTYTEGLSHIIKRDFFPGLMEVESQKEYLNALDSRDSEWIASARNDLRSVMTPGPDGRRKRGRMNTGMTPASGRHGLADATPKAWTGDTPISAVSGVSEASTQTKQPEMDTNMSLSAFQQKYTSEDNESFYKLLDKQNEKKNEKYAWLWGGNKIPAARQIAYRKQQERLKATEEGSSTALAVIDPEKRPAMPDSWTQRPDNTFMFPTSSVEDTHPTTAQLAEESSRAPPKAVIYDNTRIPPPRSDVDPPIPPSPSLSAVRAAIAGQPRRTSTEVDFSGSQTPRVNGYAFVDSEEPEHDPELEPPSSLADDHLLDSIRGDATPNPFSINPSSSREALHHRMVDKVAVSKRQDKRIAGMKTPVTVPRFASSPHVMRGGGLTPAAQRLLGRVGGGATPGVGGGWEGKTPVVRSRLGEGWTPRAKK